jgi:hypothetical protein
MKNFEQTTAKELLFKIEFFYLDWDKPHNLYARNMVRAYVNSAQILFGLEGMGIIEVIEELKTIIGE